MFFKIMRSFFYTENKKRPLSTVILQYPAGKLLRDDFGNDIAERNKGIRPISGIEGVGGIITEDIEGFLGNLTGRAAYGNKIASACGDPLDQAAAVAIKNDDISVAELSEHAQPQNDISFMNCGLHRRTGNIPPEEDRAEQA